jgi:hypothetical protein
VNTALKPTMRGERVPIGNQNAKVIRAFVHWYDERGTEDLDLTGTFIGMGKKTMIGWNGSHKAKEGCYSGDIRHRRGPCAEYIDINVEETLRSGYQYVILDVRNYNGGSLKSIKDCVFGYMEREHPKSGEVFLPATLANTIVLSSDATSTIAVIIDVTTQEYIYLDIDMGGIPVASASFNGIMESIKPYTEPPKFSVYDLIELHVRSRGQLTTKDQSSKQFNFDDFSQSYVKILEYMGI